MIKAEEALNAKEVLDLYENSSGNLGKIAHKYDFEDYRKAHEFVKRQNEVMDRFIQQHLTPTFDEVVEAWDDIDYEVSAIFDNYKEITSVMQKGTGPLKYISFAFKDSSVSFGQYADSLSEKELHAINLTIKYLKVFQMNWSDEGGSK